MFIRNFSSIKQKTVLVNENEKNLLVKNGFIPVSKSQDKWVFIESTDLLTLLSHRNGGENHG